MKFDTPKNQAYCATVVKIKNIIPLENCDNVVAVPFFGFQAIVSKDHSVGDMGIVFPVETQLSDVYCKVNNLYRHSDLNLDKGQKGYIDDNCRIRAQKFRGHTSNCLFMPLPSLNQIVGNDYLDLKEGDEFDTVNGIEICRKYVIYTPESRAAQKQERKKSRVDQMHMPEHISTDQFYKVSEQLKPDQEVIVTQKLHGTSIRIGNTYVTRKQSIVDKIAKFFGATVKEYEHDYVFWSRKVIKDANNPDQQHFYESDVWSEEGKKLVGILPENYLVYAELIGTLPGGKEIQKDYTYGFDTPQLYVYRIATVNSHGQTTDLSWDQVKEFCEKNGLKYVPELWRGKLADFKIQNFMDKIYGDEFIQAVKLRKKGIVDEGIVLRVEGLTPYLMKAKSPLFFEHETKILDTGEEDLESSQS